MDADCERAHINASTVCQSFKKVRQEKGERSLRN